MTPSPPAPEASVGLIDHSDRRVQSVTVSRLVARLNEKLVFLIDDDAAVRSALSSLLRSVGLQAMTFSSAADLAEGG